MVWFSEATLKNLKWMIFLTIGKTIEYLEEEKSLGYIYQLLDLLTHMHSLLLVLEYHETIKQLSKNKCWACQEGLASNNSMHDCEQYFNLMIEFFFDEATFFVNIEICKRAFRFPGVENIEYAVWHLFGCSFIYIIKQQLYNRNFNLINV
jgi:hypothetical protein